MKLPLDESIARARAALCEALLHCALVAQRAPKRAKVRR